MLKTKLLLVILFPIVFILNSCTLRIHLYVKNYSEYPLNVKLTYKEEYMSLNDKLLYSKGIHNINSSLYTKLEKQLEHNKINDTIVCFIIPPQMTVFLDEKKSLKSIKIESKTYLKEFDLTLPIKDKEIKMGKRKLLKPIPYYININ